MALSENPTIHIINLVIINIIAIIIIVNINKINILLFLSYFFNISLNLSLDIKGIISSSSKSSFLFKKVLFFLNY